VHRSHQLAFDLDVVSVLPGQVMIGRPPDQLPDQDRAAAVALMASLIARFHAAGGRVDDDE
jgi:hypothetical protein